MPENLKDKRMKILCNDCLEAGIVPYHVLGGKCKKCGSYNTSIIDKS